MEVAPCPLKDSLSGQTRHRQGDFFSCDIWLGGLFRDIIDVLK